METTKGSTSSPPLSYFRSIMKPGTLLPDSVLLSTAVNLVPANVREEALRRAPEERDRVYERAPLEDSPLVAMRSASIAYARALFRFLPESTPLFFSTDSTIESGGRDAARERDGVFASVLDLLRTDPDREAFSEDEHATFAMRCAADAYANTLAKHLSHKSELLQALRSNTTV